MTFRLIATAVTHIPEPASLWMLLMALSLLLCIRRQQRT
ncbi:PEP-CTERM sorting domain-containing protein [Bowmanella sp. Y57]|uniref:PEP-CTERM sorting domain-containing protein n=1 Tax=Bowmanella yangjiangensis TaxID=2811230 RepID=A0ABS3CNC2_9ALTE|nr:PEP-CTERM sorting domain-containing protein [Bowmanella yangjiangensis]